ncbi:hypothetical protein Tco_1222354, partial [Tanacetum coccineum]
MLGLLLSTLFCGFCVVTDFEVVSLKGATLVEVILVKGHVFPAIVKLVLRVEKKIHVIEQPLPPAPEPVAETDIVAQWTALYDAHTEIACLMLGSMTPELHRQFELYYSFDMIQELRSMFKKQAGVEMFDLIQSFHACKQEEGKPVADYVLKMKG